MANDWVTIARFTDEVRCQLAVNRLIDNDIEAVSVDKRESIYKVDGYIELCVYRDNVIAALDLIKDLTSE